MSWQSTAPSAASTRACSSAAAVDKNRTALSYCVNQVRTYDYENFVWLIQLPKETRAAIMALRAFNIETALVADSVKEAALAQIRMQWWRDAVDSIYGPKPQPHPVIQTLKQVVGDQPATRYRLQRIVTAREADVCDRQPPASVAGLEAYGEDTAAQLLYLQMAVAGVRDSAADHACSHLGKAVAIATMLRGTTHHARRRQSYIPVDLCAKAGVSQEDIYRGRPSDALSSAVYGVACVAKGHLDEARELRPKVPMEARPLLLPAAACGLYLDALQRAGFDPFAPALQRGGFSPLWHQLVVKWRLLRGDY
ncbi:hypothetical protein WJX81_005412 [Elliptochloris bilobata]|uniref:Phytoene synthase n=1 Tax=Elliptochloris bilobata TaxID=381761 RepID=A0AAW1SHW0_9CHLO